MYFCASESGTNLPPRKWNLPSKCFAQSLGAVRDMRKSGFIPPGFPFSTCHPWWEINGKQIYKYEPKKYNNQNCARIKKLKK